jgi:hypothetical protein
MFAQDLKMRRHAALCQYGDRQPALDGGNLSGQML